MTVLDGHTLRKLIAPDTRGVDNGNLGSVAWSADGTLLYAGGTWDRDGATPLRAWADGGKGVAQDYVLTQSTIFDLRPVVGERLAVAAGDPRLVMMDRSGSAICQAEPRTANSRLPPDQLRISPDGMRVRFGHGQFGRTRARFDLAQRQLDADPPPDISLAAARTAG